MIYEWFVCLCCGFYGLIFCLLCMASLVFFRLILVQMLPRMVLNIIFKYVLNIGCVWCLLWYLLSVNCFYRRFFLWTILILKRVLFFKFSFLLLGLLLMIFLLICIFGVLSIFVFYFQSYWLFLSFVYLYIYLLLLIIFWK